MGTHHAYKMFMQKRNLDILGFTLALTGLIFMVCGCFEAGRWNPWGYSCGKNSDCQAWRAFLCLSIIFMFLGFFFERVNKFKDLVSSQSSVHLVTGIIWFIGGVFEIVALSIYTAKSNSNAKWPASYALAWTGALLGVIAGILFIMHSR